MEELAVELSGDGASSCFRRGGDKVTRIFLYFFFLPSALYRYSFRCIFSSFRFLRRYPRRGCMYVVEKETKETKVVYHQMCS